MNTTCYPALVRTIEEIRLANYRRLINELQEELRLERPPNGPEVSAAFGISTVYAWQLVKGKRTNIDSQAARTIEKKMEKPIGWLDMDSELWPFPGIEYERVDRLTRDQKIEIQGAMRTLLNDFESGSGADAGKANRGAA